MAKRPVMLAVLATVAIVVFPLVLLRNDPTEFGGADGQAGDEVTRIDPDHTPWFEPLWSPPGGETESLLFALQAAFGAGVIGYVVGSIRTKHRLTAERERSDSADRGDPAGDASVDSGAVDDAGVEPSTAELRVP